MPSPVREGGCVFVMRRQHFSLIATCDPTLKSNPYISGKKKKFLVNVMDFSWMKAEFEKMSIDFVFVDQLNVEHVK